MSRLVLLILLVSLSITTTLAVDRQLLDLHRFAYIGDLERLETVLDAGADLNAKDQHGMNALLWAAYNNQTQAAQRLLAAGAEPNATTPSGFTALTYAVRYGNTSLVEQLLAAGADLLTDSRGNDALYEAVRQGNLPITRLLLPLQPNLNHTYQNPDTDRSLSTNLLLIADVLFVSAYNAAFYASHSGLFMSRFLSLILLVLLLITQYRLWWGENGLIEFRQARALVSTMEQENQQLKKRNQRLDAQVQDLKSGLDAVDERARFDLGMIGSDETFFWLIGQPPAEFSLPESGNTSP